MLRLHICFALALLQSTAVESFQLINHHRKISSRRTWSNDDSPPIVTALHAEGLSETELKSELSEYLKKREEANADAAAKE